MCISEIHKIQDLKTDLCYLKHPDWTYLYMQHNFFNSNSFYHFVKNIMLSFIRYCYKQYQNSQQTGQLNYTLLQNLARNRKAVNVNILQQNNQSTNNEYNNHLNYLSVQQRISYIAQHSYNYRHLQKSKSQRIELLKSQNRTLSFVSGFRMAIRKHYLNFHKQQLIQLYQQIDYSKLYETQDALKQYLVQQLHLLIKKDGKHVYSLLQFLNFCTYCNEKEIQRYFGIKTTTDIDILMQDIQYENKFLITKREFLACTNFNQYVEFSRIQLGRAAAFIEDHIFQNVFLNIENRLQLIISSSVFLVIRSVNTGSFYVSYDAEEWTSLQLPNDLYDVVIVGFPNIPQVILQLRIRYLSYYYDGLCQVSLTLGHPDELKTLAIHKVKINNLAECTQLKNFYTSFNSFDETQLAGLTQLARIFSKHDNYTVNTYNSLLQQIMLQNFNTIEYVNIRKGTNAVETQQFDNIFPKLRYFNVEFTYMKINNRIKFSLSQEEAGQFQLAHATNGGIQFNDKSPLTISQYQQLNRIQKQMKISNNDTNNKLLIQLQNYIQEQNSQNILCQIQLGRIH